MSIVADSRAATHGSITNWSVSGISDRILARQLFDNQLLQREQRHRFHNIVELIATEGDAPAFLDLRRHQMRDVAHDLIHLHLKAQAELLAAEIDRRRSLDGAQ